MKKYLMLVVAVGSMNVAVAQSAVSDFFSDLKTFSADFSQTVKQDGNVVQESLGSVQLKKPLQFRWDYKTPEEMQLISDGQRFYHYDVELAQVTVKPMEEVAGTALTTLLSDKEKLDEVFTVKSFGAPAVKNRFPEEAATWLEKADIFYELTPKQSTTDDAQATLVVVGLTAQRQLSIFYAEDAYGENVFLFDKVSQNKGIADKSFRFKAPKGVDVLGE